MGMDVVWREIEAREAALRMDLDLDERRRKPPFFTVASTDYESEITEIETALRAEKIDIDEAIERIAILLKAYYQLTNP